MGNDPAHWRTNVRHYRRVHCSGVYPGIDVEYHGSGNKIEYDFIVEPGADPSQIQLAFDGFDTAAVDPGGDLVLRGDQAKLRHQAPVIYQESEGFRHWVEGCYVVDEGGVVSFEVTEYDRTRPLILDPKLILSAFLGGNGQDFTQSVDYGPGNTLWVAGATQSSNFPFPGGGRPRLPGLRITYLSRYDEVVDDDGRSSRVLARPYFSEGAWTTFLRASRSTGKAMSPCWAKPARTTFLSRKGLSKAHMEEVTLTFM